jgi:hypothetical protein
MRKASEPEVEFEFPSINIERRTAPLEDYDTGDIELADEPQAS